MMTHTIRTLILVIAIFSCATLLAQYDMPPATVVVAKAARTMLAPSVDVPGTGNAKHRKPNELLLQKELQEWDTAVEYRL